MKFGAGEAQQTYSNRSPDRTDTTFIQSAYSSYVDYPSESESNEEDSEHEDHVGKRSLPVTDFYTTREKSVEYPDWLMQNVKEPHINDVLYGRGGGTNHHPGNMRFRQIVETKKIEYLKSKRLDKPLIALQIIREWRAQEPPGRFLKLDENTSLWHDVGDKKAREKTSQALREKAPLLRKQQEEQDVQKEIRSGVEDETPRIKTIKFDASADGKRHDSSGTSREMFVREHSLGFDYLDCLASDVLKNFSWDKDEVDSKEEETREIDSSKSISYDGRESSSRLQYDIKKCTSLSGTTTFSFDVENSFSCHSHPPPITSIDVATSLASNSCTSRSKMIKRETSYKNESLETKPHQDKRLVRSRGTSVGQVNKEDFTALTKSLEHSTLLDLSISSSCPFPDYNRPFFSSDDRMNSVRSVLLEFSGDGPPRVPFDPPHSRLTSFHQAENLDLGITTTQTGSSAPANAYDDSHFSVMSP